jgi:hypothetical protein
MVDRDAEPSISDLTIKTATVCDDGTGPDLSGRIPPHHRRPATAHPSHDRYPLAARRFGNRHALLYCRPEPLQHLNVHTLGIRRHKHLIDQALRSPQESKNPRRTQIASEAIELTLEAALRLADNRLRTLPRSETYKRFKTVRSGFGQVSSSAASYQVRYDGPNR